MFGYHSINVEELEKTLKEAISNNFIHPAERNVMVNIIFDYSGNEKLLKGEVTTKQIKKDKEGKEIFPVLICLKFKNLKRRFKN